MQHDRPRHLHAVREPGPTAPHAFPAVTRPGTSGQRARLTPWQRMETEQARELVDALGQLDAADITPARLAFVLGRLHGHAASLLDVLDAITDL